MESAESGPLAVVPQAPAPALTPAWTQGTSSLPDASLPGSAKQGSSELAPLPSSDFALAATRAGLGVAGLGAFAYALLRLSALFGQGRPLTGLAMATAATLLSAVLLAGAAAPARVAVLARAPRLATPQGLLAYAAISFTGFFVFGFGALVDTASTLEELARTGSTVGQAIGDVPRSALLLSLLINFTLFTIPVLMWMRGAQGLRLREGLAWLGVHRAGLKASVLWALMSVLVVFWFLVAAGIAMHAFGNPTSNDRAEAIGKSLDVPSALLVAAMTGVGEELFFRGFLLKKVGLLPQAVLFGLAHLNYLQGLELLVTAGLGYMFGRTVQRTGNLWGPILGHATFNAISLLLILYKASGAFPA